MFADEVYQQRHRIGGVDFQHSEILCLSRKLMAGHFDYTGCVHYLSLLPSSPSRNLVRSIRFVGDPRPWNLKD